jgi:mannose-6-phosphate isomerase-like protein (cupin superfamily)
MKNKTQQRGKIEIQTWEGPGYRGLISFGDWLVALLNWEERFDPSGMGQIERHNQTDEVFTLIKGRCLLFIVGNGGVEAVDMEPGVLYNIPQDVWHNLLCSRDAALLIVESRNTSVESSEFRSLESEEKMALAALYPEWLVDH